MSSATGETELQALDRDARTNELRARLRSLVRGQTGDPVWARPALLALLLGTAVLYIVGLAASGWANAFYSAAVQAGSQSWKAFLFGSFDSSNFITVDKPPASLWVMDISARLFGVNSWSILVPQALEGVAAVGLLYATVRRRFTPGAGLLAGVVLALTPVAALVFRFNNPDALLTLLLVAAAYALTRALEHARTRWLLLVGVLIGFGFLTKMLQAFLVVPGFALVYLVAAPATLRRRITQLLGAGLALFASGAWWIVVVTVWPASSRPYIGGSQDNSILSLIFGYNGFGRLTGNETGSVGGGGQGGGGMWGETGIQRLFGSDMGTQISWLLPAALLFLGALLWWTRQAARTDARRAAVLAWGTWLVVTGLVLSFAKGIIHPYYTVVLAPPIGALVGIGMVVAWQRRASLAGRLTLAAAVAGTAVWAFVLLDRTPGWQPWLRYAVVVAGLGAAAVIALALPLLQGRRGTTTFAVIFAAATMLAAPAAYALQTSSTAHTGSLPSAGPSGSRGPGGGFGGRGGGGPGNGGVRGAGGFAPQGGQAPGGGAGLGAPGMPSNGGVQPNGGVRGAGTTGGTGGLGGLLNAGSPSAALVTLLQADADSYSWVAAIVGANSAAGVQLAAGHAVMAIGGFNGTDPSPTLAEFQAYVAHGKVHYFIAGSSGGRGGAAGGSSSSSSIAAWVAANYTAQTVGGATVYDLGGG